MKMSLAVVLFTTLLAFGGPVPFPMGMHCLMAQRLVAAGQTQGNPNHTEPPPGWFCTPNGWIKGGRQTNDRPCMCHRMCVDYDYDDGSGNTQHGTTLSRDIQCTADCFDKACACPKESCE